MRLLWAVSSVGLGHVMRDLAVVARLSEMGKADVDWLAPPPAADFLRQRGVNVLPQSDQLAGSGRLYAQLYAGRTSEVDLMAYVRGDTLLHRHDFGVSAGCWRDVGYDAIVGDEAFWLLSGFSSRWARKPAPFVFVTDFIGTKAMSGSLSDRWGSWYQNLRFVFSHFGPDAYVYVGDADEIPDEPLGFGLPRRRRWAKRHCRFVRPIVGFRPQELPAKDALRGRLGLPVEGRVFVAVVGPLGDPRARMTFLERVFALLREAHPEACFVLVGPEAGEREWIRYHRFLEPLHEHLAAADCVLTEPGYGKVAELLATRVPFVPLPLDRHFEQEHFMHHRLRHYGGAGVVTLRDHTPEQVAAKAEALLDRPLPAPPVDDGSELAGMIVQLAGGDGRQA